MAAIGPACAADSPYPCGKLPPFFLGCLVDDFPATIVRTSGVLEGGFNVFGQIAGSGVELTSAAANSGAGHGETKAGVAAFTEPTEIARIAVRFVAVPMIDDEKPRRTAQGTLSGSGRAARGMVSPAPQRR